MTTLCLTSFGGLLCMTIGDIWLFKRRSPLETRKVALDNLILQSIPCHQAFSIPHSTGNFCTVYLILHSFMLHSWTYSSVSFFFTGCCWREDKTLPLQCKQQLLFTVLFRWLHVYLGNTPVNIWVYLLAFFWCVVVNFSVL